MLTNEQFEILRKEVAPIIEASTIPASYGWPNQISMALVDAVFSIRARYNPSGDNENPTGLLKRLRQLKASHPEIADDLSKLVELGAPKLIEIMGDSKSGQQSKAGCVIHAAQNYLNLEVRAAADLDAKSSAHKKAYISVKGLGPVTYEYFAMLLGTPGVKADTLISRFVNRTLDLPKPDELSSANIRETIVALHQHESFRDINLSVFDNIIWRHESRRNK
ncbi:hypothetical protein ACFSYH_07365 [Populibacterium corticicola]|uniref:Uncharacterized protein n=1 Tax=Populibacterium corticicola TaxID=1812826 RepID=A0ABW5XEI2_9MICO